MSTLLSLISNSSSLGSPVAIILPSSPPAEPYGPRDPQEHPEYEQEELTHADFRSLVLSFRAILVEELGVTAKDVVALSMANTVEFMVAFVGITVSRAVSAPLNPAYSIGEFQFYLGDTKPAILFIPPIQTSFGAINKAAQTALEAAKKENVTVYELWFESWVIRTRHVYGPKRASTQTAQQVGDPCPEDIALVLHTSGTTGRPKSVPLSHKNLMRTTTNVIKTYNLTPSDRTYLVMPLFHVHGLVCAFLSSLAAKSSITLPRGGKFSISVFWHDFTTTKCNWYTAVPTIHSILLSAAKSGTADKTSPFREGAVGEVPKIRFIRSCSSSLAPSTLHALESAFHAPVLEAYAMTEAAHQMTSNVAGRRSPGTVGIPVGTQISIRSLDDGSPVPPGSIGEVCVRGENVFGGYWNNEKANSESFWLPTSKEELQSPKEFKGLKWFRTGDQGMILAEGEGEGKIKLTGRIKELINRGGEKIGPLEVDAALLAVQGVREAVCFGVEDQKYGEVVWAGVVLEGQGEGSVQEEERIKGALSGKISKFKIPERIIFANAIPKTATGKVQRRFVRDAFVKQARKEKGAKL